MGLWSGWRSRVSRVSVAATVAVAVTWLALASLPHGPSSRHHGTSDSLLPHHPPGGEGRTHPERTAPRSSTHREGNQLFPSSGKVSVHVAAPRNLGRGLAEEDANVKDGEGNVIPSEFQVHRDQARRMKVSPIKTTDQSTPVTTSSPFTTVVPSTASSSIASFNSSSDYSTTLNDTNYDRWPHNEDETSATTNVTNMTDYYYYYYDYDDNDYHDENEVGKHITFSKTLFLCEYIYSAMYGSYENTTNNVITHGNSSVTVISDESFVKICLPFYLYIDAELCESRPGIVLCNEDDVAFLEHHDCDKPSEEDVYFEELLGATLLEEDQACFDAVCGGDVRVLERQVEEGVRVRLINLLNATSGTGVSCHRYIEPYYRCGRNECDGVYTTRNLYWPCCFQGYDVVWLQESGLEGLVVTWSFLPSDCRAGEWFLMTMAVVIVLGGIVGNIAVIVVMGKANDSRPRDFLGNIKISLATADLLLTVLVLAPGLYVMGQQSGDPFEGQTPGQQSPAVGVAAITSGFWLFSGMMMNTCCVVSLLNIFFLSVTRYCAVSDRCQSSVIFTPSRVKGFIIITWTLGTLTALALMHSSDGSKMFWHSMYKLPLALPPEGPGVTLVMVMVVMGAVCLLTLVMSALAVSKFLCGAARGTTEHERQDEADLNQRKETLSHLLVPAVFFLISSTAAGAACILQLSSPSLAYRDLLCYLCWWLYLAAVCWNPWLYSLPLQRFRHVLLASLRNLTPKGVLRPSWLRSLTLRWRRRRPEGSVGVETSMSRRPARRRRRLTPPGLRRNIYTGRVI